MNNETSFRMLDAVDWKPVDAPASAGDGIPYVTYEGVLLIGAHKFRVYQLNTGMRVINQEDMGAFFTSETETRP